MLIGIHPALNPDVLYVLASMGHGDVLTIVDKNFPATSVAASTTHGKPVRMDNLTAPDAIKAILSVFPLDTFITHQVERMEVVGDPTKVLPIAEEVQREVNAAWKRQTGKEDSPLAGVERFAFYEKAKKSYAVIVTGELRFYGCFLITKGVIPPPPEKK